MLVLVENLVIMKFVFIFLIILSSINQTKAQKVDYLDIRDSLTSLTCGKQDKELANRTVIKLEAFDTNLLKKNIQQYYYDLGYAYYIQYAFTNDTNRLRKSIQTLEKAIYHKPKYSVALWMLSLDYHFLNNCPKSLYYLNRHKKATPKKRWMKDQFTFIVKKCE